MQKQLFSSGNSQDKYSLQSKSGRKLYRRINSNARIINKSHLTNRTDNSIGSVALRRTELSNDKIYSRQQDFVPVSPSNYNNNAGSLYQLVESKNSPQVSQYPSGNKYEQRMIDDRSGKSSRSDSKRSQRYKHHDSKKISKHQIEQLFSLESRKNSRPILNDIKRQKSHSRSQKSYDRCSIEQSGQSSIRVKNSNFQNTRPLKSIRSNLKSQIKSPRPRDNNDSSKYLPITPTVHHYQISKLEQKYQNYYLNSPRAHKESTHRQMKQSRQKQRSRRDRNQIVQVQRRPSKQNQLKRYRSDKCIREKDYEVEKKRSSKRQIPQDSQLTNEYQKYNQVSSKKHIKGYKNYKQQVQYGYSEAYQDYPRAEGHHRPKKRQEKYQQDLERKYQGKIDQKQRHHKKNSNYQDSLLELKSKVHHRKDLKNIKIRDQTYSNIYTRYGQQQDTIQQDYYHQQRARDERHRKQSSRKKQTSRRKYQQRELPSQYRKEYCQSGKGGSHHQNQKKTDISDTFDSLVLSINSRMLAVQGGHSSVKDIKQRVELHLTTLKTIEDYSNEFKKMYEEIEQWEELIFLSFKKYWVEITKVLKYLKLCRQGKRHQSERVHAKGKLFSGSLSPTSKNICSQNQYIKDSPADQLDHIQNPFTFPFCTISEQDVKIFCKSQEGVIKMRELDQECSKAYRKLQDQYNMIIGKSGNHINMVFCDNFADDIYVFMLEEIQQMLPNLEEKEVFEATKLRLGKIVKTGILIAFLNGKVIENFADIITYDDIQTTGRRKRLKIYTCYDIYYQIFEKIVVE